MAKNSYANSKEKNKEKTKKEPTPACCVGCIKWELFGKDCWVYWDLKKHCTLHSRNNPPVE